MSFPSNTHTSLHGDAPTVGPTVADILREAAQYLQRHGWTQGQYYTDPTSPHPKACALGAIAAVIYGEIHIEPDLGHRCAEPVEAFDNYLYDSHQTRMGFGESHDTIADWNDKPDRTTQHVITALEAAAHQWEGEHPQWTTYSSSKQQ